jgi:predicted HNH restriction endonuclease
MNQEKIVENPKNQHSEIIESNTENYSERINLNENVQVSVNVENWYISITDKVTGKEVFIQPWSYNDNDERTCKISVIQNEKGKDPIELDYLERSTEV